MVAMLATVGIAAEQALVLSLLLGFSALINGLIGLFPIALDWERFLPARVRKAAPRPNRMHFIQNP